MIASKHLKVACSVSVILLHAAVFVLFWQHRAYRELRQERDRFRGEAAQVGALRDENARLRQLELDRGELERLRQERATMQLQLARLRDRAAGAVRGENETARLQQELKEQLAAGESNVLAAPMAELMQGAMVQRMEARLLQMRERLNLSPEQAESLRGILMRQAKNSMESMKNAFGGRLDPERLARMTKEAGNPETEIQALLSLEQRAAYQTFKDEEAMNNARLVANAELLQMQTTLALSAEQQDRVFRALYDQTVAQMKGDTAGAKPNSPGEAIDAMLERKFRALEGVLTPAQMEAYRKQQEMQMKFAKDLVERLKPPAPAGPTP